MFYQTEEKSGREKVRDPEELPIPVHQGQALFFKGVYLRPGKDAGDTV